MRFWNFRLRKEREHGQILEQVPQKNNMQKQPIGIVEMCLTSLLFREMQVEDTTTMTKNLKDKKCQI